MGKHNLADEVSRKITKTTLTAIVDIIKDMASNNATAADFYKLIKTNDEDLTLIGDDSIVAVILTALLALNRADLFNELVEFVPEDKAGIK